jgi:hypothetical protein
MPRIFLIWPGNHDNAKGAPAVHPFHHYHECTKHSFGGRGLRPGTRFLEYKK